ncbi:NAD(P)H-binding protein [Nocardia sp. NBC_01503]|uniref:NAD(P)-dependent oxidoreductase n=1 Tax=Nocardia sp. NBC_01503 TaxID=2975997 RepID=UPI002E7B1684|nr:NAD(P)H-binding protein [Nocardia sp. NBC_01503]WTL34633.1 NAD(P)H-binding protein [Nocardia sp. NBC_01503]
MRITVFGATGGVGSRVVTEALSRGHQVRAVSRDPGKVRGLPAEVMVLAGDATDAEQIRYAVAGSDLVISATRPGSGNEHELSKVAAALLEALADSDIRLLVVGGAGSLTVPGTGAILTDQPGFPAELMPIASACNDQLAVFENSGTAVDWAYLSPSAVLEPGERTGSYRLGAHELISDDQGDSAISMEDLAVVLLDEAERPKHHRTRFTAGY